MRKFFGVLFLLLILGGTGFFFGWAQLPVPPGAYGVVRSKTHGIDPRVIREGEFRWIWYKLIPANVAVLVFTPQPVSRSIQIRGDLPSGAVYAGFAGMDADFSYEITGSLSFNIKAEALPDLVSRGDIADQEGLEGFEQRLADEILTLISQLPGRYPDVVGGAEDPEVQEILSLFQEEIAAAYPVIENVVCGIRNFRAPDTALYRSVRSLYEAYLNRQRAVLEAAAAVRMEQRIASWSRFDELEKYGELLTKYPVLLQYLALEKDRGDVFGQNEDK
jgi:hypothetical protein